MAGDINSLVFELAVRMGDDRLVLGQRLAEWCGHAHILEEDIALTNISLDLIGQASRFLQLAGTIEGKGRNEDTLAFHRDALDYRNLQLVELPCGDFGFTIARQFLFDAWSVLVLERMQRSNHAELAGNAAKALKEDQYHLRHSSQWMIRLGDGTTESNQRVQKALNELWRYTPELFEIDETLSAANKSGLLPDISGLKTEWMSTVTKVLAEAKLTLPTDSKFPATGSRAGHHTEALGHLLAEMQFLPRAYPGASW